jgi:protein phosphatase methylesterase 1
MGGAVAVASGLKGVFKKLVGVAVIDIVEGASMKKTHEIGSALQSLRYIKNLLSARPKSFTSIQKAIDWSLSNGYIKNRTSAELSVPAKLIQKGNEYYWRTDLLPSEQFWTGKGSVFNE